MKHSRIYVITTLIFLLLVSATLLEAKTWKIGVLAKRGAKKAMEQWIPMSLYLTENIPGEEFVIQPLSFEEVRTSTEAGSIDFLLTNSSYYVELNKKYGAQAIVTMVNSTQGKGMKQFGGVLLVKADSPINTFADIKGKKFAAVNPSSFGGYQMAAALLKENGIDCGQDFSEVMFMKTHDAVAMSVLSGKADIGTVRTDTLERMEKEGKLKVSDFKIINPQTDDFPFVRSTILYPEWLLAKIKATPDDIAAKVKQTLMDMPQDSDAAKAGKIIGWIDALDYAPVLKCLEAIGINPSN